MSTNEKNNAGENVFETLSKINVNDKTEKKNGLTYLSWAWAWGEVKKRFPDVQSKVYETPEGCIYWTDGKTCWVKTGVTINGQEYIEYLPVMDYANRAIPLERVTSMDANKAIQRSITKAIARHGLGLYIYAGEDLPEDEIKKPTAKELGYLSRAAKDKGLTKLSELKALEGCHSTDEISYGQWKAAMEEIEKMEGEI